MITAVVMVTMTVVIVAAGSSLASILHMEVFIVFSRGGLIVLVVSQTTGAAVLGEVVGVVVFSWHV